MMMSKAREDFKAQTKKIIALRSGYRCAHPECDGRTTVGPAKQPDRYEDTGKASHIFAASKRGPRGRGNLSPDEIRSVANGIWLCAQHADQVDINQGKDYPPPVLLGWKAAHEFRIAREHGAMLHPFGWIESLHIIDTPVFKPDQRITFASLNVIVGKNGVGKTTICEWLWSLKDSSTLWRWGAYPKKTGRKYHDVRVAIDFRAPAPHRLEMEISGGRTSFILDRQEFPFSPVGYEVSAVRRDSPSGGLPEADPAVVARCLGIDEIEAQALADHVNTRPGVYLQGTEWRDIEGDDGPPVRRLYCKLANRHTGFFGAFGTLSGGESGAVLMDLAITRARLLAVHRPTLLMVDTDGLRMSEEFLSLFLEALSAPDTPFQSILVTPQLQDDQVWGGWQVIRLDRPPSSSLGEPATAITVGEVHAARA